MCDLKPIRTEGEFAAALARIDVLMGAEPGTPEATELDLLGDLALLYEYRNEPVFDFEGRALIKFWIEEKGWTVAGINELLDDRGDIAAVIAGQEEMTPAMAEMLHQRLRIPAAAWRRAANGGQADAGGRELAAD